MRLRGLFPAGFAIGLVLLIGLYPGSVSSSGSAEAERYPLLLPSPKPMEFPFAEGELLEFEVFWKPVFLFPSFRAGRVRLKIEPGEYQGRPTFHIQAWAESEGTLSRVAGIEIRDYFESHVDRHDFRSYWNRQKLHEGSRRRELEITFDYESDGWTVREIDLAVDPSRVLRDVRKSEIPSPAVDVLSAFYLPRLFALSPGDTFSFDLNQNGTFRRIRVRIEKKEKVSIPLGSFSSIRMATVGGVFGIGGDLRIWYRSEPPRFPVRFETEVKFGRVYGDLVRYESPKVTRTILRVP